MIKLDKVTLPHGIHEVSAVLPEKRLIGVLGANGAGKSSLIKSIAGIITPVSGRIEIDGCDSRTLSYQARSALIAYLAQDTPVHWSLSVFDVIALGAKRVLSAQVEYEKVHAVAQMLALVDLLEQPFDTLSGGECARVHLARCLMKDAPVLLADEPIAALDPYYQIEIMQQLKRIALQKTCVVVLHHLALGYQFCDNIVLLKDGQLIAAGETQAVIIAENLATAFRISARINTHSRTISAIEQLTT